jgi:hypothetical protein
MRSNVAARILATYEPQAIDLGADNFGSDYDDEPETGVMDYGDDFDEFGLDLSGVVKGLTGTLQKAGGAVTQAQSTTKDISKVVGDVNRVAPQVERIVNKVGPIVDWIDKYKVPLLVAGGVIVVATGVSTAVLVKVVFLA